MNTTLIILVGLILDFLTFICYIFSPVFFTSMNRFHFLFEVLNHTIGMAPDYNFLEKSAFDPSFTALVLLCGSSFLLHFATYCSCFFFSITFNYILVQNTDSYDGDFRQTYSSCFTYPSIAKVKRYCSAAAPSCMSPLVIRFLS